MIARIRAWIRARLPTWAQLALLSRTVAGALLTLVGLAAEHVDVVRSMLTSLPGVEPWHVSVAGGLLVIYARYRDAKTGANPA